MPDFLKLILYKKFREEIKLWKIETHLFMNF